MGLFQLYDIVSELFNNPRSSGDRICRNSIVIFGVVWIALAVYRHAFLELSTSLPILMTIGLLPVGLFVFMLGGAGCGSLIGAPVV